MKIDIDFTTYIIRIIYSDEKHKLICGCLLDSANFYLNGHTGVYYSLKEDIFKVIHNGYAAFEQDYTLLEILTYLKNKTNCSPEALSKFFKKINELQEADRKGEIHVV